MKAPALSGLAIACVRSDADLEAMVAVRSAADPENPPPRIENLRQNLAAEPTLRYLVARLDSEPVGCGFVETHEELPYAQAHVVVVTDARRRGIGSELVAAASERARVAGNAELQGEIRESDGASRAFFERRGYAVVGGEKAVALALDTVPATPPQPPPGVTIASRAERPDVAEGMYAVAVEAEADIPGNEVERSFELWRASELGRPTAPPELCFVALAGDEVVGYASLDDAGRDAYNRLTAVKRAWRRRGIATALKRAEIATAKERGFRRLVTASEERNLPMRTLNEKLGYRPEPSLSTVVMRGPLL
jgi:GNAT superfamily N-acetyltransferase